MLCLLLKDWWINIKDPTIILYTKTCDRNEIESPYKPYYYQNSW